MTQRATQARRSETSRRVAGVQLKGKLSVREAGSRAVDRRGGGGGGVGVACKDQQSPLEQPQPVIV